MKRRSAKGLHEFLFESTPQGPGQAYLWKENMMQMVQQGIRANAERFDTQEDYLQVLEEELENIRAEVDTTVEMVRSSLSMVPFAAWK
jgi:hypothetical protein